MEGGGGWDQPFAKSFTFLSKNNKTFVITPFSFSYVFSCRQDSSFIDNRKIQSRYLFSYMVIIFIFQCKKGKTLKLFLFIQHSQFREERMCIIICFQNSQNLKLATIRNAPLKYTLPTSSFFFFFFSIQSPGNS